MNGIAQSLDHVGIVGADAAAMAEVFEKLGFTLTRPAGTRPAGDTQRIMFAAGHLELIAVADPAAAHIVALGVGDAAAALERVKRAGLGIAEVAEGAREDVRFATLALADAPEGRLLLIQQLTPDTLRTPRYLGHTNRAVALREVVIASPAPAEAAGRFSRLTGLPVRPDPLGGFVLTTGQGQVRLLPQSAIAKVFPGATPPVAPWIAGMVVETDDGNAALLRRLSYYKVAFQACGPEIVVAAAGMFVAFRAAAPSIPV